MEKTVYLAGPITGLTYDECTDWREKAIDYFKKYAIHGISPMRAKNYLSKELVVNDAYSDKVMSCSRGITTRDRFDSTRCNVFLANLLGAQKVSIGTMIEYGWADSRRTPIITIMEKEGNPHEHSILKELTGFRVETLEEGLYVARAILDI